MTDTTLSLSLCVYTEWQLEYNSSVLDEEAMKKEVDEYMAEHDARVAQVRAVLLFWVASKGVIVSERVVTCSARPSDRLYPNSSFRVM